MLSSVCGNGIKVGHEELNALKGLTIEYILQGDPSHCGQVHLSMLWGPAWATPSVSL